MVTALLLVSLPLAELLNLLDSSVHSCDVRYTLTTENLLASTYRDGRRISSVYPSPEERVSPTRYYCHYILSGRKEMLAADGDKGRSVFQYDGISETIKDQGKKEAVIRKRDLHVTHEGEYYPELFRSAYQRVTFLSIFQQRGELVTADNAQPGVVVIEFPPDVNKRSSLPNYGFTLHVSLDNRIAITKIQRYRIIGDRRVVCRETNILRSRRISDATNFEVPVLAETTFFDTDDVGTFGAPIRRIRLEVDESRSRWNCAIPEDTFSTTIPPDFAIQDQIQGKLLLPKPSEKDVADALAAMTEVPLNLTEPKPEPYNWYLLGGGVAALLLFIAVGLYLRRRGRYT